MAKRLGSDQKAPKPRDSYTGGSDDFSQVRTVDGHIPNTTGHEGQNEYDNDK